MRGRESEKLILLMRESFSDPEPKNGYPTFEDVKCQAQEGILRKPLGFGLSLEGTNVGYGLLTVFHYRLPV